MPERLYTITQAAAQLGVHQNTLRRWANAGQVPHIVLPSGQRRWNQEQIDEIRRGMFGQGKQAEQAGGEQGHDKAAA